MNVKDAAIITIRQIGRNLETGAPTAGAARRWSIALSLTADALEAPPSSNAHLYADAIAARSAENGRWYITIGNAGFNSRKNNAEGYASEASATRQHKVYAAGY